MCSVVSVQRANKNYCRTNDFEKFYLNLGFLSRKPEDFMTVNSKKPPNYDFDKEHEDSFLSANLTIFKRENLRAESQRNQEPAARICYAQSHISRPLQINSDIAAVGPHHFQVSSRKDRLGGWIKLQRKLPLPRGQRTGKYKEMERVNRQKQKKETSLIVPYSSATVHVGTEKW